MLAGLLSGVTLGVGLALQFNPLVSLVGAVVAAALLTRGEWMGIGAVVVGAAWLLGDGLRVATRAHDVIEGVGTPLAEGVVAAWVALVFWAVGGLLIGYVVPAWAGSFVGRRVTHGTGWLAAGLVAASVSAALATLAGQLPA